MLYLQGLRSLYADSWCTVLILLSKPNFSLKWTELDSKIYNYEAIFPLHSQSVGHNLVADFNDFLLTNTVISSIMIVDCSMGFPLDKIQDLRSAQHHEIYMPYLHTHVNCMSMTVFNILHGFA